MRDDLIESVIVDRLLLAFDRQANSLTSRRIIQRPDGDKFEQALSIGF
ncbi:hypothetical protein [Sphingobium tyrosinilyticum]|uniref:Uncharacterized protein n=1 Tax=Sphingobium tyrosinilyticum TaxID=2715436 RepID=A0ABV9EYD8_9SPHN